jgi:hypothetical protein
MTMSNRKQDNLCHRSPIMPGITYLRNVSAGSAAAKSDSPAASAAAARRRFEGEARHGWPPPAWWPKLHNGARGHVPQEWRPAMDHIGLDVRKVESRKR